MSEQEKLQILILEDDESLRTILSFYLEESGRCAVHAMASLHQLRNDHLDLKSLSVAILDINLGPSEPTGIDAYQWMRSNGFNGKFIFLTGHARSHPLVQEASLLGDAFVLEKPSGINRLNSLIFESP